MAIELYVSRLLYSHVAAASLEVGPVIDLWDGALLYVDLVDSTGISERFAPAGAKGAERLHGILDSYFRAVFDIVQSTGGDILHIDGDATLAAWRGEGGIDDAAKRACATALRLRAAFSTTTVQVGVSLRHRLAVASGSLRSEVLGADQGHGFLVVTGAPMGNLFHASAAAGANEIVICATTADRLARLDASLHPTGYALWTLQEWPAEASIGQGQPVATGIARTGALRPYVSPVVADRLEAGNAVWLAEFRTLSMVYVRLNSLALSAQPVALRDAIDRIQVAAAPMEAVVSQFSVGDKGVVASIACGLPSRSQENNAMRAIETARRVEAALRASGMAPSIGVATGLAFCGDVGNARRRCYLMSGSVMYCAARLMQAAGESILVDHDTARAARAHFHLSEPMAVPVKGRAQPLSVCRVLGERQTDGHWSPVRALYGRQRQVQTIEGVLDALAAGRGAVLSIEGEPGAGKSRLLARLHRSCEHRGYHIVDACASTFERMTPYSVARSIAVQMLRHTDDPRQLDPTVLRLRLVEALQGHPLASRRALMEDVLPIEFDDKGLSAQVAGQARQSGIQDIFVRLVQHSFGEAPIVICIDDAQWLDDPSAQLIGFISKSLPNVLVALGSRPLDDREGAQVKAIIEAAGTRVPLDLLEAGAMVGIVCDVLGVQSIPAMLSAFVAKHTSGLPLHAEQLALALVDSGAVVVQGGKCHTTPQALDAAVLPDTLRDLVLARLDRRSPSEQFLAKVASVIGIEFDAAFLHSVYPAPVDPSSLDASLGQLVFAGILEPSQTPGATQHFVFRHAILRDVIYGVISYEQREPLHRRIASLFETRHANDLDPHCASLAAHWESGNSLDKALCYRERAAMFSIARYANAEALFHLDAVERLAGAGNFLPNASQRAHWARLRGDAMHELSRFAEASAQFKRCAFLSGIAVPEGTGAVTLSLCVELGRQILHRFGVVPRRGPDAKQDELSAHIFTRLAEHAYFAGDALALVHRTITCLNRAERAGVVRETVEGLGGLAIGLGTAGLHRLANFYRRRAVAVAQRRGRLHDQGFAHLLAGVYAFQAGRWDLSDEHCAAGAAICDKLGDRFRQQTCCLLQAYADLLRGRYDKALTGFDLMGTDAEKVENVPVRAWALAGRSLLDMVRGNEPHRAVERLALTHDMALQRAERLLCDGVEAAAQFHAGDAASAARRASSALDSMLKIVPTMGIALWSVAAVAEVHLDLGAEDGLDPQRGLVACRVMSKFARSTRMSRPRAMWIRGRAAQRSGLRLVALFHWYRGLREARRFELPVEEALCHLSIAQASASYSARERHGRAGHEVLRRVGARPWGHAGPLHSSA